MFVLRKVSNMLNRLHGQPDSYDKKYAAPENPVSSPALMQDGRSRYRFGRTLGAGTYGIVREAEGPDGRVAVKIILKKNVRGNEQMVLDELDLLQRLKHPHIVKFVDWFESRVCKRKLEAHIDYALRRMLTTLRHYRTSTTSSPSLRREESCSTESANRESLPRRTPPRPLSRSWAPSTISTRTMLSTGVRRPSR